MANYDEFEFGGTKPIRAVTLYRVSTKQQVTRSDNGEDIPTQRKACRDYIALQQGWTLQDEYIEAGVSGYKKKASERDVLQSILEDAKNKKFDVLVVFMFDRLGRNMYDTPLFAKTLSEYGIRIISVKEGEYESDDSVGDLIMIFRSYQSATESRKTSIRVNETHSQMAEQGIYRGGTVPFGYKLIPSGKFNKKGKELLKMAIDKEAATVIRQIFDWVDLEGYGQYLIPEMLNKRGITTRKGKSWASNTISAILRTPTYMGYMTYARGKDNEVRSSTANPDLIIIPEDKWNRVQQIRSGRNPEKTKRQGVEVMVKNTKGEMLLIGLVRCGHCQNVLSTTPNYKKYTLKDGTPMKKRYMKYRCSGKGLKKAVNCEGQTLYSKEQLESVVVDEVLRYLDHLEKVDLTSKLNELRKRNSSAETTQFQRLSKELDDAREEMKTYKAEVILSLKGTGKFASELLNELIGETAERITVLEEQVEQVKHEMEAKRIEKKELETLKQHIPNWREVFNKASVQQKKMMLRTIIGGIHVRKDGVKIDFKLRISQFIGTMGVDVGNQVHADKVIV